MFLKKGARFWDAQGRLTQNAMVKGKQACPCAVQVSWGEDAPQREHNLCKGPVPGMCPTYLKCKVGMVAARTAGEPWGNFLVASQDGLGTHQEGLKE